MSNRDKKDGRIKVSRKKDHSIVKQKLIIKDIQQSTNHFTDLWIKTNLVTLPMIHIRIVFLFTPINLSHISSFLKV